MTDNLVEVLRHFLDDPTESRYGLDVAAELGIGPGTIYPLLARLEEQGWLEGAWEERFVGDRAGPRRRYLKLTADGQGVAAEIVAAADARRADVNSRKRRRGLGLAW